MKKFSFFAALLVAGLISTQSFALTVSSSGDRGFSNRITTVVRNNSGSTLTSGAVVIWDSSPTATANEGAWITTTTSADSNLAAGVLLSDSAADGELCEIVIYGPAFALYADSTDGSTDTAGTAIGTTTVASQFGNGTGLGCLLGTVNPGAADFKRVKIFVNPSNGE